MDTRSRELFEAAKRHIPGGVNSPVRAFGSVGRTPRFIASAHGSRIVDVDGNEMIDYVCSWGPGILGHAHPRVIEKVREACGYGLTYGAPTEQEVQMAELLAELIPSMEVSRLVSSGTEAVMSAIRAARGYTGRDKIIKFSGCYHGHSDGLLVKAGSGAMTAGAPDSLGVPSGCTQDTLSAAYNDLEGVEGIFRMRGEEIAAVVVEPVAANMGVVPPVPGFLEGLRSLCSAYGALLVFDEVITGFRLGADGAQGYYHVAPDLTAFGKIIGGGMPVGAYGGRREVMELVAPLGGVYQAGTLSGNPVAMAAGIAQLTALKAHPEWYQQLNGQAERFFQGIGAILQKLGLPYQVNYVGSLGCLYFTGQAVTDYESAKSSDTGLFARYCREMMERGVYLAPSQFEAIFVSMAHTEEILGRTLELMEKCLGVCGQQQ